MRSYLFLGVFSGAISSVVTGHFGRAVGDSCQAPEGNGTCQSTSDCKGISYPTGLCPQDPTDVQCCVEIPCQVGAGPGYCRSVSNNGCQDGDFNPGFCPGSSDIQCCVKTADISPVEGNVGQLVLAKAMTAAGVPYAWGGGNCNGPSHDEPPYQYGDIGYDCSGLVCWALCQVTGRNLFREGLRVTQTMYCASEDTLKYQKYPLEERQVGDAVFFGGSCDCENDPDSIHHVALSIDGAAGERLWNAPNDRVNQVQENNISDFSDGPCPYVIRFNDYID